MLEPLLRSTVTRIKENLRITENVRMEVRTIFFYCQISHQKNLRKCHLPLQKIVYFWMSSSFIKRPSLIFRHNITTEV